MKFETTIHDRDAIENKKCVVEADSKSEALSGAVEKSYGKRAFFHYDHGLNQFAETRFYGQIFKRVNQGAVYGTALTGRIYIDIEPIA